MLATICQSHHDDDYDDDDDDIKIHKSSTTLDWQQIYKQIQQQLDRGCRG